MATAGRTPRRRRHRRPLASAAATALTSTTAAAVTSADADRTTRSDCVGWSAVVAGIGFLPVNAMPAILQLKRWLPAGPSTSRLSSLTARDVRVHPGECLGRHLAYPPVPTVPRGLASGGGNTGLSVNDPALDSTLPSSCCGSPQ